MVVQRLLIISFYRAVKFLEVEEETLSEMHCGGYLVVRVQEEGLAAAALTSTRGRWVLDWVR